MSKSIYIIAACSLASTLTWADAATNLGANTSISKEGSAQLTAQTKLQSPSANGAVSTQTDSKSPAAAENKTNTTTSATTANTGSAKPAAVTTANQSNTVTKTAITGSTTAAQSATGDAVLAAPIPANGIKDSLTGAQGKLTNSLADINNKSDTSVVAAVGQTTNLGSSQAQANNLATQAQVALNSSMDVTHNLDATQKVVSENIANSVNSNVNQAVSAATAAAVTQTINNQVNSTINQEIGNAVKTSIDNSVNNTVTQTLGL